MARLPLTDHLSKIVVSTVEETLNAPLDAEADQLCGAKRYEHSEERLDTRAGHYERQLHTKDGEVTLKVPKLRTLPFESAIIERHKRREISVEEALVEMHPDLWRQLWCSVHPNFLDEVFYRKIFPNCLVTSAPYDLAKNQRHWEARNHGMRKLSSSELLVAVRLEQRNSCGKLTLFQGLLLDRSRWMDN